ERLDDTLRHRLDRNEDAFLVRELGEQPAVAGMHAGHRRRRIIGKLLVIRQRTAVLPQDDEYRAGPGQRQPQRTQHDCGYPLHRDQPRNAGAETPPQPAQNTISRNLANLWLAVGLLAREIAVDRLDDRVGDLAL